MRKFEGVLFCTDLDGTLYTSAKTVSKENLDAIDYFKAEGGLFTFITGRVPATSQYICDTIHPNAPYGCLNGGGIYDPVKGEYLWRAFLPPEVIELVRAVDRELPEIGIQYNTERQVYFNKDNPAMVHFREVTRLPYVACPYEAVEEPVLKIVFAHDDAAQIAALMELLNAHPLASTVDFIHAERRLYEILPKGASKGLLLRKMADLLGIDRRKTIAVGDYYNDLSMLQAAGIGFAVANAADGVKAVADHVTVSNNEHAIAAIIDGLDRGLYRI